MERIDQRKVQTKGLIKGKFKRKDYNLASWIQFFKPSFIHTCMDLLTNGECVGYWIH